MDLPVYLAMTPSEFSSAHSRTTHPGWMSCHFSACSTGLSCLPDCLPEGSLLILDDAAPMQAHDICHVFEELEAFLNQYPADGLLLDFQREPEENTCKLVEKLCALPCPVAAPEAYAEGLCCGVFLPPCPAYVPLEEYLRKWKGRNIWLEIALTSHTLTLTEDGCQIEDCCDSDCFAHAEEALCCHYDMLISKDRAVFSLARSKEDISSLLQKAQALGVEKAVGLYQELSIFHEPLRPFRTHPL